MLSKTLNILLVDDDKDDCTIFKESFNEINITINIKMAFHGEVFKELLTETNLELRDIILLGLNTPRKEDLECFTEKRNNTSLSSHPLIILLTSLNQALNYITKGCNSILTRENFVIYRDKIYYE
jgi:DNA-binding response OmpR family regulator